MHTFPLEHSVPPAVHVGLQAVLSGLQVYGTQVSEGGATQLPFPSQVLAPTTLFACELHDEGAQMVCVPQFSHCPLPSHVPSREQVDFASGPHVGCPAAGA